MGLGEGDMVHYAAYDSLNLVTVPGIYHSRSQPDRFGLECPSRLVGRLRQT